MKLTKLHRFITLGESDCRYRFYPTGDVYDFVCGSAMANLFRGNPRDGSLNNIYLRIFENGAVAAYPLLGIASGSRVLCSQSALVQEGCAGGVSYRVKFRPVNNIWFWDIQLSGSGQTVDLVYGQDLGVAGPGGIFSNDLYNSQYLGHSVFRGENGYVVCSRHNMGTSRHAYMQQGVLGADAVHYSTDGLQFFGLSAKLTHRPEALDRDLEDVVLQNEFAYTALQTERFCLNGSRELAFYGMLEGDHPEAVTAIEYRSEILAALEICRGDTSPLTEVAAVKPSAAFGADLISLPYSGEEITKLFPRQCLQETADGRLLSFFTPEHVHVVTQEKEKQVERPHGTIVITPPDTEKVNSALISSTHYIYGVFNSHVVVGNTDAHKFLSTPRNTLNLLRHTGQRLYVRLGGLYRLLTVPGLYEMGMNYSRWYYKTEEDTFVITSYTMNTGCGVRMDVQALSGKPYDFIVTSHVTIGADEQAHDIVFSHTESGLRFPMATPEYPDTFYEIRFPGCEFALSDDRIFFENGEAFDASLLTFRIDGKDSFCVCMTGWLDRPAAEEKAAFDAAIASACFSTEASAAFEYYKTLTRGFCLSSASEDARIQHQVQILNNTMFWYAHNAMIHFATPHGMEQPSGAAWGTRDICQGPMEFFLATGNHALARDVLLHIFAHQEVSTREWPQWFMFDRYTFNAGECHGDVIFWPLKSLADYIRASGDSSILGEAVPYLDAPEKKEAVLDHVLLALENIRETRLIGDTGLITYAGGDWDDTLQPASEELKKSLVSAWTEALAYQSFTALSKALESTHDAVARELAQMAALAKQAFETYLIRDGTVAGFLMYDRDRSRAMLHPSDRETGIHYRLLPMTRSIIAELVKPNQAEANIRQIWDNLKCPDGVRLMDKPASYNGGPSKLFLRAEQAANVGREISLQYTHAHIRYIEAMAKFGHNQEAWDSLFVINPILIQESVPNAVIRQSNLYFSSSEGAYRDRYEYAEKFHLLSSGSIPVKGGWRLYSSGPGIYTNQLVSSVLGIRICAEGLILDPVLPRTLDGLRLEYTCFGRKFAFVYRMGSGETVRAVSNGTELAGAVCGNPYRRGGLLLSRKILETCGDTIEIHC